MVDGTPYNLTRMGKNERWRIAIGNSQIVKKTFKKQWMAKAYINTKPIELILNTMAFISKKA